MQPRFRRQADVITSLSAYASYVLDSEYPTEDTDIQFPSISIAAAFISSVYPGLENRETFARNRLRQGNVKYPTFMVNRYTGEQLTSIQKWTTHVLVVCINHHLRDAFATYLQVVGVARNVHARDVVSNYYNGRGPRLNTRASTEEVELSREPFTNDQWSEIERSMETVARIARQTKNPLLVKQWQHVTSSARKV